MRKYDKNFERLHVSSGRIDEKRLKEELPQIYEKYKKMKVSRRFSIKAA